MGSDGRHSADLRHTRVGFVSQLHRTEARARDERKLTGWLGSRRRATRAERRLSRAIVANDLAEHPDRPLGCDGSCDYCIGDRITSEDPGGRWRA
jgi:hypothetical protein